MDAEREKQVREGTLEPVQLLIEILMNTGMSKTKACKTIRWATYRIEGAKQ